MKDLKIILKRQMSFTDSSFFLFTIDTEKYRHGIKRTEIDEQTFNKIVAFIEKEIKNYKNRQQRSMKK